MTDPAIARLLGDYFGTLDDDSFREAHDAWVGEKFYPKRCKACGRAESSPAGGMCTNCGSLN